MAQEDDMQFQSILDELRKAQEIEDQNVQIRQELDEHSESIDSLEEQTQELKDVVGEDEKQKSVIDKNKLPSTLTSAEKKRYQNIGKVFIEGAGSEFKRILKASKFKDMMSTMKEKFQVGVNKVKSAIKKAKKASGFLAKLLVIAGLLGTIFYLFKDKIKDAIPNITGYIRDIFQKAKSFIGNLVENGFNFVSDGAKAILGESVISIIRYLKETVEVFFSDTLPTAIYELYLNVLSLFSGDAEDMQEELKNDETAKGLGSQATEITAKAEEELDEGTDVTAIDESAELVAKTTANFETLSESQLNQLKVATSNAEFSSTRENNALVEQLNSLMDGGENIIQMINDGRVDAKQLFENIRKANEDGNLSREEAFKSIQDALVNEEEKSKLKFRELTQTLREGADGTTVMVDGNLQNAGASAIGAANAYRDAAVSQGGASLQAIVDAANRDRESHDKINSEIARRNQEQINQRRQSIRQTDEAGRALLKENTTVTLNATKAISETLQATFVDLTAAIKKFLNGDDISKNIVSTLQGLNNSFSQYFNEVKNGAKTMLEQLSTVAAYFVNFFGKVNEMIDGNPGINDEPEQPQSQGALQDERGRPLPLSKEFVINVDVTFDQQRRGEQAFIKDVVSIDVDLNDTLNSTNSILSKLVDGISKVNMNATTRNTTINVDEQQIQNIVNEYVEKTYINNQNNVTNNNNTNVTNNNVTNNNITNIEENNEIINSISNKIISNPQTIIGISKNVTTTIINDQEIVNEFAQNIFKNESVVNNVSTNVTNNIANNNQVINNITNNIANNTELINNVTNQVEQKLSSNVVNNVNVVEHRDNSSIVEIVDKEGRTNTITLVDKQTNDAELNVIRNDIRKLAVVASQNREQITRNSLQVSKIVNIGNVNAGESEPITLEPLHALEV